MSLRTLSLRLAALALLATCGGVDPAPAQSPRPAPGRPDGSKVPPPIVAKDPDGFRVGNHSGPVLLNVFVPAHAGSDGKRRDEAEVAREVEVAGRIAAENPCPAVRQAYYGRIFDPMDKDYMPGLHGWEARVLSCRRDGDDWVVEVDVQPAFSNRGCIVLARNCIETYRCSPKWVRLESVWVRGEGGPRVVVSYN